MNIDEYNSELEKIEKETKSKKFKLAIEYALSNSSVKVGDTVGDDHRKIIVSEIKIGIQSCNNKPCCVYHGELLTKAGKSFKRPQKASIWQLNIKLDC